MSPADAAQLARFIEKYLDIDAEIARLEDEKRALHAAWVQCISLRGFRVARRMLGVAPHTLLDALLVGQLREVQCALAMLAKAQDAAPAPAPEVPRG